MTGGRGQRGSDGLCRQLPLGKSLAMNSSPRYKWPESLFQNFEFARGLVEYQPDCQPLSRYGEATLNGSPLVLLLSSEFTVKHFARRLCPAVLGGDVSDVVGLVLCLFVNWLLVNTHGEALICQRRTKSRAVAVVYV